MGTPKRIPLEAIQAMKKTLDALPDKNLDKTKEEALAMLSGQIQKAYAKGYSVKELAAILSEGKVAVSAPTLRAYTCPSSSRVRKEKAVTSTVATPSEKTETPAKETVKVEPQQQPSPVQGKRPIKLPSYYTPDLPDDQL